MPRTTLGSIEEAKVYACNTTNGELSLEKAEQQLLYFRGQLTNSNSEEQSLTFNKEIERIYKWLASPSFKNGKYARGLDDLLLELIEWRATIYAFQNVETEKSPFREHIFYSQWLIGGTYAAFALLGQLVGRDKREKSLRNLWGKINHFMKLDNACTSEEIECINQWFNKTGHFSSKALQYRHTVIAHNVSSPTIEWIEIDEELKVLVRIWSLIVSWSSFGRFDPFRAANICSQD